MPRLLLPLLALILSLTACGPSLEVREETDDLGFRKEFEVDEAGVRQGYLKEYDNDGNLVLEENYTDGELNGIRKVFSSAGVLITRDSIVMGDYTGESRTYRDDGSLEMRGVYSNNAMNGLWYSFHPNGSVKAEMSFADNQRLGPTRQWYPNGQPELSGTWGPADTFFGPLIRYDSTGTLERVLNCDERGICITYWTPDSTGVMPVVETDMTLPSGY